MQRSISILVLEIDINIFVCEFLYNKAIILFIDMDLTLALSTKLFFEAICKGDLPYKRCKYGMNPLQMSTFDGMVTSEGSSS